MQDLLDREFVRRWVNWEEFVRDMRPGSPGSFEGFLEGLAAHYEGFTPEFAEAESGVPAITPLCVRLASATARASPKSVILTRSSVPFSSSWDRGPLSPTIARAKLVRSQVAIDEASRRDESAPNADHR